MEFNRWVNRSPETGFRFSQRRTSYAKRLIIPRGGGSEDGVTRSKPMTKCSSLAVIATLLMATSCSKQASVQGKGDVGGLLKGEFARLRGSREFIPYELAGVEVSWNLIRHDEITTMVNVGENHLELILNDMQQNFGRPQLSQTNEDGYLSYSYNKKGCGLNVNFTVFRNDEYKVFDGLVTRILIQNLPDSTL